MIKSDYPVDEYVYALIRKKCGEDLPERKLLFNYSFIQTHTFNYVSAFVVLLNIWSGKLGAQDFKSEVYKAQYSQLSSAKRVARNAVLIVAVAVPIVIFEIIPFGNNVYVRFFVKDSLLAWIIVTMFFLAISYIYRCLKIGIEGDFLHM